MDFFSKINTKKKGETGEGFALHYFQKNGYKILETNWRTRKGEVDLIVEKKGALYFVEVKFRTSAAFGRGEDSIHPLKQRKMLMAALDYLQRKKVQEKEIHFGGLVINDGEVQREVQWIEFPLDLPTHYY